MYSSHYNSDSYQSVYSIAAVWIMLQCRGELLIRCSCPYCIRPCGKCTAILPYWSL